LKAFGVVAMGRERGVQGDLYVTWEEMPRSPGHVFYDCLQEVLSEAGFDAFVEETCKPYYAPRMGAPSLPPGRYFRMHMIGYFEGIDSERGIVWRCSDSWSLREFLRLANRDKVPDRWVLNLVAARGLVKGERIGVDGSTMEANAALRTIVRRDSGETYREMLTRMAQESGVATPSVDDLARLDRKRKGKTLSNADWTSKTDPDAKIARIRMARHIWLTSQNMRSISIPGSSSRRRSIRPTTATRRRCRARWRRRRTISTRSVWRRRGMSPALSLATRAIIPERG
jgi:transposase